MFGAEEEPALFYRFLRIDSIKVYYNVIIWSASQSRSEGEGERIGYTNWYFKTMH